jgi:hypothetical protein
VIGDQAGLSSLPRSARTRRSWHQSTATRRTGGCRVCGSRRRRQSGN